MWLNYDTNYYNKETNMFSAYNVNSLSCNYKCPIHVTFECLKTIIIFNETDTLYTENLPGFVTCT